MELRFTVKNSSKGSRNFEQDNTAVKQNETRVALVMIGQSHQNLSTLYPPFKPELHRLVKIIQIC